MVEAEQEAAQDFGEGYINDSDPSVLRFLIASRCTDIHGTSMPSQGQHTQQSIAASSAMPAAVTASWRITQNTQIVVSSGLVQKQWAPIGWELT